MTFVCTICNIQAMSVYTYRAMTIEDYDEVYSLWKCTQGIGLGKSDSRENIEKYLQRNNEQSFVCKCDGKIVGAILCGNDGRRASIYHAAVAGEHRRKGIAAELVRLALDAQRKQGITKCNLVVFADNEDGKTFWTKMGFETRLDIGIMSKAL